MKKILSLICIIVISIFAVALLVDDDEVPVVTEDYKNEPITDQNDSHDNQIVEENEVQITEQNIKDIYNSMSDDDKKELKNIVKKYLTIGNIKTIKNEYKENPSKEHMMEVATKMLNEEDKEQLTQILEKYGEQIADVLQN